MEKPEEAIQAFLAQNAEFIKAHGQRLAEGITNSQLGTPVVKDAGLDDDLAVAFNNVAGNAAGQLVILQLQTNRRLDQLVGLIENQTALMKEPE